eukprot:TRINITY_DN96699_c0_g1_i1.p1 TRINITY_DN96699_c0_g1~~TRINITY_DN96699_c0_g1_i1.p1  ORF type:complete len:130 (+),score=77.03 TRINITY_DN96699_c0_g1_i1:36-425(+)
MSAPPLEVSKDNQTGALPDVDDAKSAGHFVMVVRFRAKKGKRKQLINGWDSTNCAFYRKQESCLDYWLAEDPNDEDVVLAYCKFVSKEAFDSLPAEEDKDALDKARGPFMQLMDGKPEMVLESSVVFDG